MDGWMVDGRGQRIISVESPTFLGRCCSHDVVRDDKKYNSSDQNMLYIALQKKSCQKWDSNPRLENQTAT